MRKRLASFSIAALIGLGAVVGGSTAAQADVPNPSGELLGRSTATIPANPIANGYSFTNQMVVGTSNYFGPWTKALLSDVTCALRWEHGSVAPTAGSDLIADSDEHHPFTSQTFEVEVSGEYTFRVVNSSGIADPFLALVEASSFDKTNPENRILGCNDDSGDSDDFGDNGVDTYPYPDNDELWSQFVVDLTPGTYTIVMSTYSFYQSDADWYTSGGYNGWDGNYYTYDRNGDDGSGSAASAVWEFWGPTGGIDAEIECDGCAPRKDEPLAATGSTDSAPIGALAIASLMIVAAVVMRRQKRTH